MMKMIGNVGRKFRTAYMKTARRKTTMPKPMSDDWRVRNRAGETQARNEFKQHMNSAEAYTMSRVSKRQEAFDAGYPKSPSPKKKPARVSFKGQDMQERNFMKSFTTVGGYKYGTIVPKASIRSQGVSKAVRDASAFEGGTKRNWAKNYKTRSYQP